MIKFEDVVTPSPEQWKATIMGARNPLNSWNRSDSKFHEDIDFDPDDYHCGFKLGPNDYDLLKRLRNAGTADHRKFMRMLPVMVTITAPLYWWKEFDTYKVGTVANSCSTMHKIADKEFTLEDFSTEHFITADNDDPMDAYIVENTRWGSNDVMNITLKVLNYYRNRYLKTKDKKYWWQMIQLLPSSYNQKRTVMCNYETLTNIYKSRKDHKLDEWKTFCNDWIKNLPYSDLITGEDENEKR